MSVRKEINQVNAHNVVAMDLCSAMHYGNQSEYKCKEINITRNILMATAHTNSIH